MNDSGGEKMSASKGDYQVNISEVLKKASVLSKTNNWVLVQGLLCVLGISLVIYWFFFTLYEVDLSNVEALETALSKTQQVIMDMTLIVLLAPIWTGMAMLAIYFVRGQKPPTTLIFTYFKILPVVAVASGVVSILVTLGFLLLIIPSFYFFTATTFALPLIADKNYGPWKAIIASILMTNKHLVGMLGLYGIFALSLLLIPITFGLAFLWIGPLYFNAKAILYEDLFCQNATVEYNEKSNANGSVFNA
jgi:uncharacterized membrane protein